MRTARLFLSLAVALLLAAAVQSRADNGSYTYAGGAFSTGTAVGQNIKVSGSALSATGATLSFSCPITSYGAGTYQINWACAGGSVTITTPNQSVIFHGTFVSGSMGFSGSGGGKGGHVSYSYSFYGAFSGTLTSGGVTQAANGSVSQYVKTTSQLGSGSAAVTSGTLGWNSAYSPLLVGDNTNGRIVSVDGITGANLTAYGKPGSGTGRFTTIAGLTQDASGRIYVTDSALNHLVRIDGLSGANWTQIGSTGVGNDHFSAPLGVTIDASGKIWVADSGNNRIVRMDDMSGTNWTSFGTLGTGANQFSSPASIAFDATGRIYVADKGNNRLVRFDDLTGKNWIALTEVLSGPYGYLLNSPESVQVNAAGQIFVVLGSTYGFLIRVNDMTGASPILSEWSNPLSPMSLDKAGTIYVTGAFSAGLAEVENATATGYFASSISGAVSQPGPVFASASTTPTPAAPVLSVAALAFGRQNVGEPSAAQNVTLSNLGAATLTPTSIATSTDYKTSSNCLAGVTGGASCTISVVFDPKGTGTRLSNLTVASNGVHPSLKIPLSGFGTSPKAIVLPAALTFDAQMVGTSAAAQTLTLTNTGTGPLTISSIVATGDYSQTNNCGTGLQPGSGCTVNVVFKPTVAGARSGAITISDDASPAGAHQVIALFGIGTAGTAAFTLTPESVQFPGQLAGTTSASQAVILKNNSAATAALGTPTYPAGFKVTTTCGASLAAGASCAFHAAFTPAAAGPVSGVITIPITGQAALTVGLSGTGTATGAKPVLVANPAALNFGQVVVGDDQTLTFTVTNTSGQAAAIQSHVFSGDPSITLASYNCPAILAAGASCTVGILFTSTSTSALNNNATFTFTEGSGAVTQVMITGQSVTNGGM